MVIAALISLNRMSVAFPDQNGRNTLGKPGLMRYELVQPLEVTLFIFKNYPQDEWQTPSILAQPGASTVTVLFPFRVMIRPQLTLANVLQSSKGQPSFSPVAGSNFKTCSPTCNDSTVFPRRLMVALRER